MRFDHERKFSHPHQQLVENCDWLVRHLQRRAPSLATTTPILVRVDAGVAHLPIVRPANAAALIAAAPADTLTPAQVARLVAVLRPLARHGEQRYHTREA